jgi:hypothetical protein
MKNKFSVASLVLSYFLVAGGMFTGMLALGYLKIHSEAVGYLFLGLGAFAGGYVAARASRGSTIIEPAIGGLAVVATFVGLIAATEIGKTMWSLSHGETVKAIALTSGSAGFGALAGAWISEKYFGEPSPALWPWFIYTGLATFGSCLLVTLFATMIAVSGEGTAIDTLAKMMLAGLAIGCLVGGVAVGASANARPLGPAFVGGGAGVAGFLALVTHSQPSSKEETTGIIVLALGGAIVTLIGAAIGWAVVGKKAADHLLPAETR